MEGCLELQLSCEVSNEFYEEKNLSTDSFLFLGGAPWQDLQLLQTILPQGQLVIIISKHKLEEL